MMIKWFMVRPTHAVIRSPKEGMIAVLTDENCMVDSKYTDRRWLHYLDEDERRVYNAIKRAFYRGRDHIVANLNTGRTLLLTPERYW